MGLLTGRPQELRKQLRDLQEPFKNLAGQTLITALNLYSKGGDPQLIGWVLSWYDDRHLDEIYTAIRQAARARQLEGKEIDRILQDYFSTHLNGERPWVKHLDKEETVPKPWTPLDEANKLYNILTTSTLSTSHPFEEDFIKANPHTGLYLYLLRTTPLSIEKAYNLARYLPPDEEQSFFTRAILTHHRGLDVERVADYFLKQYDPRRAAPETNIILHDRSNN